MKLHSRHAALQALFWTLSLLSLLPAVHAEVFGDEVDVHYSSCTSTLQDVYFGPHDTEGYYAYCTYAPALGTLAYCLRDHAKSQEVYEGALYTLYAYCSLDESAYQEAFSNASRHVNNDTYAYWSLMANISGSELTMYTMLSHIAENGTYVPLRVPDRIYKAWHKSNKFFLSNYDMSNVYGYVILAYWAGVMFLGMVHRFLTRTGLITAKVFYRNPVVCLLQRYVVGPNLIRNTHNQQYKLLKFFPSLLPTRVDGLIIFGYVIVHIAVLGCNWEFGFEKPLYYTVGRQTSRILADRTGIIAFAHLPLIFLFPGRNNFLTYITGFNTASFIQFHRWVGRIMALDAFIHSVCYSYCYGSQKAYKVVIVDEVFVQYGMVATVACGLFWLQSGTWIKNHAYEIFLYSHIALAIAFTVGVWYHCNQLGWMEYIYASIAVWAFDRFVRIVRMFQFGLFQKSTLEIVSQDTIRLSIAIPRGFANIGFLNLPLLQWKGKPGQFVYVYFGLPQCFLQSHPFSASASTIKNGHLIIYIKHKKGVTDTIFKRVSKKPGKIETNMRVLIEGPYGESAPIFKYDNTICVAGGNGVPGPFKQALDLSQKYSTSTASNVSGVVEEPVSGGKTSKKAQLIWVARDFESIMWFRKELQLLKNSSVVTKIIIYLTKETSESIQYKKQQLRTDKLGSGAHDINSAGSVSSVSIKELQLDSAGEATQVKNVSLDEKNVSLDEKNGTVESQAKQDFVFRSDKQFSGDLSFAGCDGKNSILLTSQVQFITGRPNMDAMVEKILGTRNASSSEKQQQRDAFDTSVEEARAGEDEVDGSVAFTACGPGMLCDSLRKAITKNALYYKKGRVDYYEELQIW